MRSADDYVGEPYDTKSHESDPSKARIQALLGESNSKTIAQSLRPVGRQPEKPA